MSKTLGIFDSGVGGLTVLDRVIDRSCYDRIVYFGDTARVPYGSKGKDTIVRYGKQDVRFLLTQNVDEIIVACGTVSANALEELKSEFDISIRGVIDAAAQAASAATKNGKIGVLGTEATIRSGIYESKLRALAPNASVHSVACPLFVPLVENGFFAFENAIVRETCRYYLKPLKDAGVDTVVLGCTHYPLLRGFIADFFGGGVTLIDQGEALADSIPRGAVAPEKLRLSFFVSDDVPAFQKNLTTFMRRMAAPDISQIAIEDF